MGGVPRTATDAQLAALAAEIGEVHSVTLLKDPQNPSQNRGCAAPGLGRTLVAPAWSGTVACAR